MRSATSSVIAWAAVCLSVSVVVVMCFPFSFAFPLIVTAENKSAICGGKAHAAVGALQTRAVARIAALAAMCAGAGSGGVGPGGGGGVGLLLGSASYQGARGVGFVGWHHPGFEVGVPAATEGADCIFDRVGIAGNGYLCGHGVTSFFAASGGLF